MLKAASSHQILRICAFTLCSFSTPWTAAQAENPPGHSGIARTPQDSGKATNKNDWRMGFIQYKRGDYAAAVDTLMVATKGHANGSFDAHYYLANSYVRLNKIDSALSEYKEAIRIKSKGKEADYCLRMLNYYSKYGTANARITNATTFLSPRGKSTARVESYSANNHNGNSGNSGNGNIGNGGSSASNNSTASSIANPSLSQRPLIDPMLVDEVKSKLPTIKPFTMRGPFLSEILAWNLRDRAAFINESQNRVTDANARIEDAQQLLKRARSIASSLVPNSRDYGETEEHFRDRQRAGQTLLPTLLVAFESDVELKQRQLRDETQILETCQAAARDLNNAYYNRYGTTNGTANPTR